MKLYPAIVTGHLLGGVGLLALLAAQASRQRHTDRAPLADRRRLVWATTGVLVLVLVQVALGGWVSTNYAVLACTDFPTCQGAWWPTVDFHSAFQWQRELGQTRDGAGLPFAALTAIHLTHRLAAIVVSLAVLGLAWMLWRQPDATVRRCGQVLAATLVWQILSGVSNVVLGWPLAAAVAHTGGAAVLVATLAALLASPLLRRPNAATAASLRPDTHLSPAGRSGLPLPSAGHAAR
jgi:cytochrome c oxidase assembly protein subunit 15